jgi:uncharacterized protein YdeI (YjbR/CyaY-like superfamily)
MSFRDYERFHPLKRKEWRDWLQSNHEISPGMWLVSYKKATGKPALTYDDIVEEALCFGWIDSVAGRVDDERTMLLITPRKPKSGWSRSNKERIERLAAQGLLAPAGIAAIERARSNGSWEALDASEDMVMPEDLAAALAKDGQASNYFEKFPPSTKKAIYQQVNAAKRPETREKRVTEVVRLAHDNRRFGQWRDRG